MAYYDPLIAEWPSLGAASASPEDITAAQAAFASPQPAEPTSFTPEDIAAWQIVAGAWHQGFAALFTTDAVLAKLAVLAGMSSPGSNQPVPIATCVGYLREQGVWLNIKASTNPAALAVIDLYEDSRVQTLDFSLPVVQSLLAELVTAGLVTQEQAAALQSMGIESVPWWKANGYLSSIGPSDLEAVFAQSNGQTVLT